VSTGAPTPVGWSDERVEQVIGRLLRVGVLIAAAVTALGGLLFLARHGMQPADYRVFAGTPGLQSLRGIARALRAFDAAAIIQLGLVLLIATPIARVALSLLAFAKQRDWRFVVITSVVLALLLYGLVIGHP
jgi:uncharacterized membrane protein